MPTLCRFPNGVIVSIRDEDERLHPPHFHAIKNPGRNEKFARIYWKDNPVSYDEPSKKKMRLARDELKKATEWAARRRRELDKAHADLKEGRTPERIPL